MIRINGVDVTSLVDITSVVTNDTLDETLASGSMTMPFTTQSVPYARFSQVDVDGILFVVAEDSVTLVRKGSELYRHQISLIEPTKILQKRVIPNLTVTQPKGDIANYIFSVNRYGGELLVGTTQITVPLTTTSQSQDTAIIEGLTLKNTDEYEIIVDFTVQNRQVFSSQDPLSSPSLTFEVQTLYGASVVETRTYIINGRNSRTQSIVIASRAFKDLITPTTQSNVNFKVRCVPELLDNDDEAYLTNFVVRVAQRDEQDNVIRLDNVVDKLLMFHPEFTLSDDARTNLSTVISPEFTFQNLTLYDALREIANFNTSIVYLGENDFTTIHFYKYDQVDDREIEFVDKEQVEYLDGFTDGFEMNAANVIRDDDPLYAIYEPDQLSWLTIRSATDERGVQIIDTQTAIHLQHPIYRPIEVRVKGLAFNMLDNGETVSFADTVVWDITDYVVEQQRYNTFETEEVTNARGVYKRKSNTVYYVQGQPLIQGLGYIGTVPPAWNTEQVPNYAIVEAILNKAQELYPDYTFSDNYLLTPDVHALQFRIRHIPYSDIRLTVYKDGQDGNNIMYYNESAQLNDMELLGRIAQENVNRSGNRVVKYQGFTFDNSLPLGSKNGNEVLVNYTISRTPTINKFTAEYAVGYANISDYVGVDSAYRQYEVPNTTIVNRRDKVTQFLKLTAYNSPVTAPSMNYIDTTTNTFYESLFGNFKTGSGISPSGSRPTYAKLTADDKVIQSTIDAYRMGRTIGLAVDMQDNYSAGIKKIEKSINITKFDGTKDNIDVKIQEDARYTDDLGRVENITIEYFDGGGSVNITEADIYPDNDNDGVVSFFEYQNNIKKDARERYGFVWELVCQSTDSVQVYDGFVKYNRLAAELVPNKAEIRLLDKGYFPQRNLDITRTQLVAGVFDVQSDNEYATLQLTPPEGEYEGVILTVNGEPILAIRTSDYNFGTQVTKYIFTSTEANQYIGEAFDTIYSTLEIEGAIDKLGEATIAVASNLIINGIGQPNYEGTADNQTVASNMTIVGTMQLNFTGTADNQSVASSLTITGVAQNDFNGQADSQTVASQLTLNGSIFLEYEATSTDVVRSNAIIGGSIFITESGDATSQNVQSTLTINGAIVREQEDNINVNVVSNLTINGTSVQCVWEFEQSTLEQTDISQSPTCSSTATKIECTFNKSFSLWECNWYGGNEI